MRLFFYYVTRTVKNQIRKLFKTWVAVFILACFAIGVVFGLLGAALDGAMADAELPEDDTQLEQPLPPDETTVLPPDEQPPAEADPAQFHRLVETVAGVFILLIVVMETVNADKSGSNIFPMADVNLLFASPMRPQSVLLFRLCCQMGIMIFLGIYLLIEVPLLVTSFGLTPLAAIATVLTFALTLVFGKLWNVLLYTLCSTHPALKRWLRPTVYLLVGGVALGFVYAWQSCGTSLAQTAPVYFSAPLARYVPVFGWLKAFLMAAVEGKPAQMALFSLLLLAALVLLTVLVRRIRADFYEDALAHSTETAELLQAAQERGSTGVLRKNKKDRSEHLLRDGMRHGRGANVFFFKTLYNRFRFGHLHFFTKTAETYLITALGVTLLQRLVLRTDDYYIVALVLAGMTFFRALGNPLPGDVNSHVFRMAPESPWAKLLWSTLGGSVNCALDLAPALLVACAVLAKNPLHAVVWLLFSVSVDLYATAAHTFIDLSVSGALVKQIKQMIMILFLYFGLIPDVILIVMGFLLQLVPLGVALAGIFNLLLGGVLMALSPLFFVRGNV